MIKYVIASSQCESLLTTKDAWEDAPDNLLNIIKEFEAPTWEEAYRIYDKTISPPAFHTPAKTE